MKISLATVILLTIHMSNYVSESAKALTDSELEALFNAPIDLGILLDAIFDIPFPKEMYVYEYLLELSNSLPNGSPLQKFADSMLKKMQQRIDDFCVKNNLEKISIKALLQNGLEFQRNMISQASESTIKRKKSESPVSKSTLSESNKKVVNDTKEKSPEPRLKGLNTKSSTTNPLSASPTIKSESKKSIDSSRSNDTLKKAKTISNVEEDNKANKGSFNAQQGIRKNSSFKSKGQTLQKTKSGNDVLYYFPQTKSIPNSFSV